MTGRSGFTLIEILVVLILLGIMTTTVTVYLATEQSDTALKGALDRLVMMDQSLRHRAATFGQVGQLAWDSAEQRWTALSVNGQERNQVVWQPGRHVRHLHWVGVDDANPITINASGRSASYGCQLTGTQGRVYWIWVNGLTGQVIRGTDEKQFTAIAKAFVGAGTH